MSDHEVPCPHCDRPVKVRATHAPDGSIRVKIHPDQAETPPTRGPDIHTRGGT